MGPIRLAHFPQYRDHWRTVGIQLVMDVSLTPPQHLQIPSRTVQDPGRLEYGVADSDELIGLSQN